MSQIYRWRAENRLGGGEPITGRLHIDFDAAMMATLTYATWVAWSTDRVEDATQPVLQECDGDGPTEGDWGWTTIPTDDARVLAYFDQPDADEIERGIVGRLRGMPYWLPEETAMEALTQVEQYDGYRVQSLYRTGGATREEESFTEVAKAIGFNVIIFDENGPRRA